MKVGMIFECGPQGADKQVCEYLAQHIRPGINLSLVTLDNKANLLRDAGEAAKQLLADGCCCVLVVWDLRPAWPTPRAPCRTQECAAVNASLQSAGVPANAPIHLVCIEQELESWLLACDHAISALLSRPAHPYSTPRVKKPDAVTQPKAQVIKRFKQVRNRRYDDKVDAIRVLKAAAIQLPRLRRSMSFARFEQKLLAC